MSLFGGGKRVRTKKDQFDFRHLSAASALAMGRTAAEAAEVAQVSERTIENWKKLEGFEDLIDSFKGELVAKARLNMDDTTVLSKRRRLELAQRIYDSTMRRLGEDMDNKEFVLVSKLGLDTIAVVSKELGQEGKPLEGMSDETGLPVVNLGIAPGSVIEAYAVE